MAFLIIIPETKRSKRKKSGQIEINLIKFQIHKKYNDFQAIYNVEILTFTMGACIILLEMSYK